MKGDVDTNTYNINIRQNTLDKKITFTYMRS